MNQSRGAKHTSAGQRLFWHGMLLSFLGLASGAALPAFANPRMGLAAHVGTVMAGMLLAVIGLGWSWLRLGAAAAAATYWTALYGIYGSSAGLFLAAAFGTSEMTPIHGAGYVGTAWQEAIVNAVLATSAPAMLLCCVGVLWGLRQSE